MLEEMIVEELVRRGLIEAKKPIYRKPTTKQQQLDKVLDRLVPGSKKKGLAKWLAKMKK